MCGIVCPQRVCGNMSKAKPNWSGGRRPGVADWCLVLGVDPIPWSLCSPCPRAFLCIAANRSPSVLAILLLSLFNLLLLCVSWFSAGQDKVQIQASWWLVEESKRQELFEVLWAERNLSEAFAAIQRHQDFKAPGPQLEG